MDVVGARSLACELLAPSMPTRWSHVAAVARTTDGVAESLGYDPDVVVSAAWLHDVGYASDLVDTGFHPLDGARFLRGRGCDPRVVALVAHHSCAVVEARLRGLDDELVSEFPLRDRVLADALCFADMTTGPDGRAVDVGDRLDEIRQRYGPGAVVTRFVDEAEPEIVAAVARVEQLLKAAQSR